MQYYKNACRKRSHQFEIIGVHEAAICVFNVRACLFCECVLRGCWPCCMPLCFVFGWLTAIMCSTELPRKQRIGYSIIMPSPADYIDDGLAMNQLQVV